MAAWARAPVLRAPRAAISQASKSPFTAPEMAWEAGVRTDCKGTRPMNGIKLVLAGLTLASAHWASLASAQPAPTAPIEKPRPIAPYKIILVGDSTTAVM